MAESSEPDRNSLQRRGWLIVVGLAALMTLSTLLQAVWLLTHAHWLGLIAIPPGLLFEYWIAVGALRRMAEPPAS